MKFDEIVAARMISKGRKYNQEAHEYPTPVPEVSVVVITTPYIWGSSKVLQSAVVHYS